MRIFFGAVSQERDFSENKAKIIKKDLNLSVA